MAITALSSVLEKGKQAHSRNVVLSGDLVEILAVQRPHTKLELHKLPGLGVNKRNAYGSQILNAIQQATTTTPMPTSPGLDTNKHQIHSWWYASTMQLQHIRSCCLATDKQFGERL